MAVGGEGRAELSPTFKYAFFTLLGLMLLFLFIALGMTIFIDSPTKSQSSAEAWLFGAASSSFTALIGLVGGKVT